MDDALPEQSEKRRAAVQPRTTDDNSWPTDRGGEHCVSTTTTAAAAAEICPIVSFAFSSVQSLYHPKWETRFSFRGTR